MMKIPNFIINGLGAVFSTFVAAFSGYKEIELPSDKVYSRDLDAILSNAKDREKYNDAVQRLKDNRMKADGVKSETIQFSDRTITISIE